MREAARMRVTLPAGWEMQTTPDGQEFYVNLRSNLTQWQVPKLPAHWEERFSRNGEVDVYHCLLRYDEISVLLGPRLSAQEAQAARSEMRRSFKVKSVAIVGIIVATYALYVENRLKDPFYQPGCSASWTGGDCATVFKSSYGHILSHWGIVPKGSVLDFSLPILGLVLYGSYWCAISISSPFPFREKIFLTAAIGGILFNTSTHVYYLSLFDGRTQWDWPQENAEAFERRLEELEPSRMLALPGSTQELSIANPDADDASSQASDESSLGIALDEVDANELLAVPPGTEIEMTPREDKDQQQLTKWGADQRDAEWISLKRQMAGQKKAHDERWLTARHFPGVREFVLALQSHIL
eukprot:s238_g33.t2